jgi:hypothetical protein
MQRPPRAIAFAPTKHHGRHAPHPATVASHDFNHQPNGWFAKCARVEEDGEEVVMQVMQEVSPPQYAHPPTDDTQ